MTEYILTIETQAGDLQDFVEYLNHVANLISQGYRTGEGWDTNEVEN